ncbi:MAG: hypothetical protein ACOC2C_04820 [Cyclonatronaceae bacterium]
MSFKSFSTPLSRLSVLLLAIFIFNACDTTSSDTDDHDHGEHADPFGLKVMHDGQELARQFDGEVSYTGGHSAIEVEAGVTYGPLQIMLLAEDGDEFLPDDEDYFLRINIADESIVHTHDVDAPNFSFGLHGDSEGETTASFDVMHIDHSDFESMDFAIKVEGEHGDDHDHD